MPLKQVTQDHFYAVIGPQDVHPTIINGRYPYTSDFKTPQGRLVGKVVGRYENPPALWPVVQDYFLVEA